MRSFIRLSMAAIAVCTLYLPSKIEAATIKIRPTDLLGNPRVNGQATVLSAVNADNLPVRDSAVISPPDPTTGEIQITINDPNVRAITVLVQAGGALNATLQNLLVADQTTFVALPKMEQAPCCCVERTHRSRRCGFVFRR